MATAVKGDKLRDAGAMQAIGSNIFGAGEPDKVLTIFKANAPLNPLTSQQPGKLDTVTSTPSCNPTFLNHGLPFMRDTADLAATANSIKQKQDVLNGQLRLALQNPKLEEIQSLIDAKAEATNDELHELVRHPPQQDLSAIVGCLIKAGAKPSNGDRLGNDKTLQWAVVTRAPASVFDQLLKAGAKADEYLVDAAMSAGFPLEVIRSLLNAGAQPPADALAWAINHHEDEAYISLLLQKRNFDLPRATFDAIPRLRQQAGKEPYSEKTMGLLKASIPESDRAVASAQQPAQDARPVAHAQEQPEQPQIIEDQAEPGAPSSRGCLRDFFYGLWACLLGIFTSIINCFSREDEE